MSVYFKSKVQFFQFDPDFPLWVRLEQPQRATYRHQHEFCECAFVIDGNGKHQSGNGESVSVQRDCVIVIPIGGNHAYTEASEDFSVINLLFDSSCLPPVLLELYHDPVYKQIFLYDYVSRNNDFPITHLDNIVFDELETMLIHMKDAGANPRNHCYKLGLFMAVLSKLCSSWKIRSSEQPVPLDIPKLVMYLEQNFAKDIYLDDLVGLAGMSKVTLLRHFRAALGVTPMIYLRNLRLRHAAELLIKTDLRLKEIADQSGFFRMPYFFEAFRKCYGMSPLEYRSKK